MKKPISFSLVVIIIIALALMIVLLPLFRPGFFISDDGEWMVIRLSAFYQSLVAGQFPVRFLGRLNQSYGYPVSNFLYPGFLYVGSLFHLAGLSFPGAVKMILGMSVVGGTIATYINLRSKFHVVPSLIGAISFAFSPYLLYDLYHRGSVGEVLAAFAASLCFLAVMRKWTWLLTPAVAFLILSHNTVALLIGIAISALVFVHPKRNSYLLAGLLGIGLSAFFWIPAIIERVFVQFDATKISNPFSYFIGLNNAHLLGITTILAVALISARRKVFLPVEKILLVITVGGMYMALPISHVLWQIPILGRLVQFPYRFLVLPVVFSPWIIARMIESQKGWHMRGIIMLCGFIWLYSTVLMLSEVKFVDRPIGYYVTNEATTNVANEYMPKWVRNIPMSRPVETLEVIDGDAVIAKRIFSGEKIETEIFANGVSNIQINKIYYPGWGVTLDRQLIPINYNNPLGVMQVEVPRGQHVLVAQFRETPLRFAADIVSLISSILYLIFIKRITKMT